MNYMRKTGLPFILSFLLIFSAAAGCIFPDVYSFSAAASEVSAEETALFSDNISEEESFKCDCCHSHLHSNDFFGRILCFFCKISMFFRNLFLPAQQDVQHKYVAAVKTPASCMAAGKIVYDCTVCGVQKEEFVPKLPHSPEKIPDVAATCTENGSTGGYRCSLCGMVLVKPKTVYLTGHSFSEYIPDNNATCEKDGTKTATCRNCGETKSLVMEGTKKIHSVYTVEAKAPDCTSAGWDTYEKCNNCSYTTIKEIPSPGHKVIVEKGYPPTCTRSGVSDFSYCDVCGDVLTERKILEASGHDFADGDTALSVTVFPSGTDKVLADIVCCKCGEEVRGFEADAEASAGGYNKLYHTLEKAISSTDKGNIYVLRDCTLKENITVKNGVTLVIPCNNADPGYYERDDDYYRYFCPDYPYQFPDKKCFRVFTVPSGKSITVEKGGALLVNAETGLFGGGQVESYGVSGNYSRIDLGGSIEVRSGGILDCSGYIKNKGGSVTVKNGGRLFETYGVLYWRGGSYAAAAKGKKIFPIDGYEMNYVEAPLYAEYGACIIGNFKMTANSQYHYSHMKLLGTEESFLYKLKKGARLIRTVEENGKTVFKFYGDVEIGSTSINVGGQNLRTTGFQAYKTDGNSRMEFYDGSLSTSQKIQLMPGFTMVIGRGAVLNINAGLLEKGSMIFCTAGDTEYNGNIYKGFCTIDSSYVGSPGAYCPSHRGDAALYVVDGGRVNVSGNSAALAGKVYVDKNSSVNFEDGARNTASLKVAVGELNGVSIFASVSTESYTIPYMPYVYE